VIKGGRGYRFPLIEAVDQLDLTNMIVDLQVHNAYSKGGIPLTIVGVANLKIAGTSPASVTRSSGSWAWAATRS
jgi:flotillin